MATSSPTSAHAATLLTITGLGMTFDERALFADICMTMSSGEVVAVIGPSGAGKSTFLRCIAGIAAPTGGSICLLDHEVRLRQQASLRWFRASTHQTAPAIGYVPQHLDVWPHLSLLYNVATPLKCVRKVSWAKALAAAGSLLEQFNLGDRKDAFPDKLSGGELQRGAICRALAIDSRILLLDEVTSALDPEHVVGMLDFIVQALPTSAATVVVTHHLGFAKQISDRVLFLDGEGGHSLMPTSKFFASPPTPRAQAYIALCQRLNC